MLLSMSACRKAPGMTDTIMNLFSLACIVHDNIMASIDTVGELVSSLLVFILWGLPSAHPRAFIVPSLFSLRNIKYLNTFSLSSYEISRLLCSMSACRMCSCFTSLSIASSTLMPYALSPSFIINCVSIMCACVLGSAINCSLACVIANCTLFFGLGCKLYHLFVLSRILRLLHFLSLSAI